MTYRDRLHPWCIVRCLPNAETVTIARYRLRNNADAALRLLQAANPHVVYALIFDPPIDPQADRQKRLG